MVQWLRILLTVQRTWVPSLVPEDSTCQRGNSAYEPRACVPQPRSHCNEKPTCCKQSKATCSNEDPAQPKINRLILKKNWDKGDIDGVKTKVSVQHSGRLGGPGGTLDRPQHWRTSIKSALSTLVWGNLKSHKTDRTMRNLTANHLRWWSHNLIKIKIH